MKSPTIGRGGALALLLGILCALPVAAQPSEKDLLKRDRTIDQLIRSIDDIVWSNITIYEMKGDFKGELLSSMQAEDSLDYQELQRIGDVVAPEPLSGFSAAAVSVARNARDFTRFQRALCGRYSEFDCEFDFDEELMSQAFNVAARVVQNERSRPKDFYLITSKGRENPRLIALVGIDNESGRPVLTSFRKVGSQLYDFLESNNNSAMYEELKEAVEDGSPELANQMFILRDLAQFELIDRTNALATYIDEDAYTFVLSSISAERPIRQPYEKPASDTGSAEEDEGGGFFEGFGDDLFGEETSAQTTPTEGAAVPGAIEHKNEAVIGTDIVAAFYSYEMNDDKQVEGVDWGIELVNNFDQINYPSIWGGRLGLNALLRNIKIGAVLPQPRFGGATIGESGIFDKPQKILGGYGAAFSGDFTFPVINNSGLFNFYASYTFGEAETENMALTVYPNADADDLGRPSQVGDRGYIIRYAFQGHYSFGFYADPAAQHLFRLKAGGTVYGVDEMERRQVFRTGDVNADTIPSLGKLSSTTHGGVSARIEYMRGGTEIPYGASLGYFDGSLLTSVWLQFIVSRSIDLKFQGKYFTPLFRDARAWEQDGLIVPSLEVKYHFGAP